VRLLHLPQRDGEALHAALVARLGDLPAGLLRSITWDQGTEMAGHRTISKSLGVNVYFCDSHSPWQRGSNENTYWYKMTGPETPSTGAALVRAVG
jgi:transposase, IS30 family